jgi:hypothetical protein
MAIPFATLTGIAIYRLHLVIPALGLWHADVDLAEATDVLGPQTLLLSGSSWSCAVIRAVDFAGIRSLRLVGGTAGWRKPVTALQYASAVGVPTATVLADAASLVGELPPVLDPSVATTVGKAFVRQSGPASLVLQQLEDLTILPQWWLDATGIVQTMPRPGTPIASQFDAQQVRGCAGWYRIATDSPGDWMPGRTFAGSTVSGTISRVEHRVAKGELWTEVLVP